MTGFSISFFPTHAEKILSTLILMPFFKSFWNTWSTFFFVEIDMIMTLLKKCIFLMDVFNFERNLFIIWHSNFLQGQLFFVNVLIIFWIEWNMHAQLWSSNLIAVGQLKYYHSRATLISLQLCRSNLITVRQLNYFQSRPS